MDHGQCITEETLTEYLEGGLDPAIKAASEVHLIACDDCRTRLAFFMRILNEDVTKEEADALEAITNQWHNKTKEKAPRRTGTLPSWFFAAVAATAAAVIVFVSVDLLKRPAEPQSATEVVHVLLERERPFELRLSNQPYLPIVRTRGENDDPGVAYGLLAGEMTRLSADSHQMGRFYLLQKDFDTAIRYLENAEREVGARADVHNDLGVAYLESGDPSRLEKAFAEFRHALEMDKVSAAAAFNLALYYERAGETRQADSQWKRYLELDSESPWAKEAQSRNQGLGR